MTQSARAAKGRKALEEDGAEVIILGCAANFGFYRQMQDELAMWGLFNEPAPLGARRG